ncbi:MAG: hypothetical protein WAK57_12365 [Desulfobacterales bacterium]|jgi:hypothetical protein
MNTQACVTVNLRRGIWQAFEAIAAQQGSSAIELIDNVLIDYIVDNVPDARRYADLIDENDFIKPLPDCCRT